MSKYVLNTDEMHKSIALLEQVSGEMQSISNKINNSYALLKRQTGTSDISSAKNDSIYFGAEFDKCWDDILMLKNYLRSVIMFTENAESVANNIIKEINTNNVITFTSVAEAVVSTSTWIKKDVYDTFDTWKSLVEDVYKEYTFRDLNLMPDKMKEFTDTISSCWFLVDVANELKKFNETGDARTAYMKISKIVGKKGLDVLDKVVNKATNLKYLPGDKTVAGILKKTIVNMPDKYVKGIIDYAENGKGTAGSIVAETVMGSFVDAAASWAEPYYKATTALTYPVIDQIMEKCGYDLSGAYDGLTGKKGLDSVFAAQKELWVDTVYAGAKDSLSKGIDGFYQSASASWKNWKSGMKLILG